MSTAKIILEPRQFIFTLQRMCHELIENYGDFDNTCLIGIQDKGVILSDYLVASILQKTDIRLTYGKIDISFHRDDFRRRDIPLLPSETHMNFSIDGKKIILVDDVLYTGRTIHAAMSALQDYGRPASVELVVFVDRRFNRHLPIQPDYRGITVDAIDEAYVKVEWAHLDGKNQIKLFAKKSSDK